MGLLFADGGSSSVLITHLYIYVYVCVCVCEIKVDLFAYERGYDMQVVWSACGSPLGTRNVEVFLVCICVHSMIGRRAFLQLLQSSIETLEHAIQSNNCQFLFLLLL